MIELSLSTILTTLFGALMSAMMSVIISKLKTLDAIRETNILLNERYKNLSEKIPVIERDLKTAFTLIDRLKGQINNRQELNDYSRTES